MKRHILHLGILLSSTVACIQETSLDSSGQANQLEIRIKGDIEHQLSTRADEKGFYDGDAFGVYIIESDSNGDENLAETGNVADNVRFVYDAESLSWIPDSPVYFTNPNQNVSIMAYYPYKEELEDPNIFPFEVSRDQRKPAANGILGGYEASDFLYAEKRDIEPTPDVISLIFRHKLANIKVTLLKGAGWSDEEWNLASKDVLVTNTIRQSVVNLSNGSVQTVGNDRSLGIVPMSMGNDIWRAVVIPQVIPVGSPVLSITVDGQSREYRYDGAYRYYDGKQNSITLSVNKTPGYQGIDIALVSEGVSPWEDDATVREESAKDYLVIHCLQGGTLKGTILEEGYQLESIKDLKVEGILNADDFSFMRDELPILQALNLMDASVEECSVEIHINNNDGSWSSSRENIAHCIPDNAFNGKTSLMRVVFPKNLFWIGDNAFRGSSIRGDIVIPEGVTTIGWSAFSGTPLNGTISFPSTLKVIGASAFSNSRLRGDLFFPEGLEVIEYDAFYGTDIKSVQFPMSLKVLGGSAFTNCTRLAGDIEIPSSIKFVSGFFGCTSLNGKLFLPEGLETIQSYAFGNCPLSGALVIPSTVTAIEEYAFAGNMFTSVVLPESLTVLGPRSFWTTKRDVGEGFELVIPEGITNIPLACFSGLNITDLVLSKNVEYIGQNAFSDCYNISSIVCEALQPPILEDGVFMGVPKDNFALEVPASSIRDYQNAPGWNEFQRIVAHRDFSISRRLLRTLNHSETKTFTLRAESGSSWTVESKPDWVTVSPMSGTGKTEVTVAVSALASGSGFREGEIVYKLTGEDYSTSTKIEQYDYQYEDGDVYAVQTHSVGKGISLVFMGDCYDAKDISEGKYLENIQEAVEHFFAIEPYNTYRDYFDVHIVFGCSEDSGIGDANTIREARFGSQYLLKEGVKFDETVCFSYAGKVHPSSSTLAGICLILNSSLEDGVTYLYDNDLFISLCPVSQGQYPNDFRGVIQHEVGGHGFGKLGDEAIYHLDFIQSCGCSDGCPHVPEFNAGKARGWYENLALNGDIHKVPWSHLIFDSKYSAVVDVYEGGFYHARGVFRSEANSCMRNKIPYYSTISRESIVKRIMRFAREKYSYESFKAKDVTTASVGTRASSIVAVPELAPSHHREPVLKGSSPSVDVK